MAYLLEELLRDVAPEQQESFARHYHELTELADADCDLQEFLDRFLQRVVQLYAATAGAIWLRSPDGLPISARSLLGFDQLGLQPQQQQQRQALVRYALNQPRSMLIPPHFRSSERSEASNPTDSFVLLGPVTSQGDGIAVLELVLGPWPVRGTDEADLNRYVLWLDHLLEFFRQSLEQRFLGNLAPLQPALTNLQATQSEIEAFQNAIRVSLEITLNSYAGSNFGSLRNNQMFTRSVHELLDANSLRVCCPECGAAAILRCQSAGNSKTGVFLYDHYLDGGRTFHGGPTRFPGVKLVAKPPRRNGKKT